MSLVAGLSAPFLVMSCGQVRSVLASFQLALCPVRGHGICCGQRFKCFYFVFVVVPLASLLRLVNCPRFVDSAQDNRG
ncbi:hypothetical protein ACLKA6_013767 [Drosophila palustris]